MNPGVLYKYMMPFNGKPVIAPPFFPIGNSSRKVFRTIPLCNWLWAKRRMIFEWFGILPFSQDPSIAATKSPIRMLASGQPFRSLECKYSQIFTPVKFVLSRSIIRISWTKRFVRQGRQHFRLFRSNQKADLSPTSHNQDRARAREKGRKEEMRHSPTTVMAGDQPKSKNKKKKRLRFSWKMFGVTPCSKECGGGMRFLNFFVVYFVRRITKEDVAHNRSYNASHTILICINVSTGDGVTSSIFRTR